MRHLLAFIKSPFTTNILLFVFVVIQVISLFFIRDTIKRFSPDVPDYYTYLGNIESSLDELNRSNKEIRDEIDRVVNHIPYVSTNDIEKHLKSIKEDVMGMSIDVEMIKKSMWTLEVNTEK